MHCRSFLLIKWYGTAIACGGIYMKTDRYIHISLMLITYPNEWLSGNGKKHFKKGTGDVWAGNKYTEYANSHFPETVF